MVIFKSNDFELLWKFFFTMKMKMMILHSLKFEFIFNGIVGENLTCFEKTNPSFWRAIKMSSLSVECWGWVLSVDGICGKIQIWIWIVVGYVCNKILNLLSFNFWNYIHLAKKYYSSNNQLTMYIQSLGVTIDVHICMSLLLMPKYW